MSNKRYAARRAGLKFETIPRPGVDYSSLSPNDPREFWLVMENVTLPNGAPCVFEVFTGVRAEIHAAAKAKELTRAFALVEKLIPHWILGFSLNLDQAQRFPADSDQQTDKQPEAWQERF